MTAHSDLQTKTGFSLVQKKDSKHFWAGWEEEQKMGLNVRNRRKVSDFWLVLWTLIQSESLQGRAMGSMKPFEL